MERLIKPSIFINHESYCSWLSVMWSLCDTITHLWHPFWSHVTSARDKQIKSIAAQQVISDRQLLARHPCSCVFLIEQESDGSEELISAEFRFQASTLVLVTALSASRLMRQTEEREIDMGTACDTEFRLCVTAYLMHPTIKYVSPHLFFAFAFCYILETD